MIPYLDIALHSICFSTLLSLTIMRLPHFLWKKYNTFFEQLFSIWILLRKWNMSSESCLITLALSIAFKLMIHIWFELHLWTLSYYIVIVHFSVSKLYLDIHKGKGHVLSLLYLHMLCTMCQHWRNICWIGMYFMLFLAHSLTNIHFTHSLIEHIFIGKNASLAEHETELFKYNFFCTSFIQ